MKTSRKILIVDDSLSVRKQYRELLEHRYPNLVEAADGREASHIAVTERPMLIITDFNMPEINGFELCRMLQTDSNTRDIPIIIVSTFDSDSDVEGGFEAGASAYLSKRDVDELLLKTVNEIVWKYSNVRQKHILVVEDSKSIALFIAAGLTKNSFVVTVAQNGAMAKSLLRETRPDLILSDIKMPEMDGFALCRWIKANPDIADIPFVAMSAGEETAVIHRIIQYGAAAYIIKPFSMNQLVPLIDRILSDHFRILLKDRERLDVERNALVNSIESLVTALEARDPYTKGHSEVVSAVVTEMLALSGAEKSEVELIAVGGRLHDIGKIGIRDSVLLKPDRLTEEEYAHIKEHPTIGMSILAAISSLERIVPVTYSHHERWDGKGYPEGLKGTQIPFWARLTSVADTFDALTSDRPYRQGMPTEKAFQIIQEASGTQLCPDSVDLFFGVTKTKWFEEKFLTHPS
jgi:response regulator RpfG family c-di-GMP phosphodiesterase